MAVPDGAILRYVLSLLMPDSVIAQNVFYAVFADTGGSDDEDDVISDLDDWVEDIFTHIIDRVSDSVDTVGAKVYLFDPIDDDWDEVGTGTPVVNFSNVADMTPHGVAALVHMMTTDPDVMGGKYIAGLADANFTGSDLEAGIMLDLIDFGGEWVTPFVGAATGGDFGPGVWSVAQHVFKLANLTYRINGQCAYQRRRKPGVGI